VERKPEAQHVFSSKDEAIRHAAAQNAIDQSYLRMARELLYQTLRDAHAYATDYTNRFKVCGGNRSFDAEAAKARAHDRIVAWVHTPIFETIAKHLGYDPENCRQTVLNLLQGKDLDKITPMINELKHEGRIYGYRGPSPKEAPKKGNS